jgi:hypothetical protein
MAVRRPRWAAAMVVVLGLLLALAPPVQAKECGCTNTGEWKAPKTTAPATGATSPDGGRFTLETSQTATQATLMLRRSADGRLVESFTVPLSRLAFGFSPDGDRFMFRHGFTGSTTRDVVVLYDLDADRRVYESSPTAGFAAAFSPHGRWFLLNVLNGPGNAQITVVDAVSGVVALDSTLIFSSPPGSPGDRFGSVGTGFSSEPEDRSFVWAYVTTNGDVSLNVRNLSTRANVLSTSVNTSGFWKFSPCGDAFGLVTQPFANSVLVRLHKTDTIGTLGTEKQFSPVPASIVLDTTLDWHRVKTTNSQGTTTTTNIASNTADTACAQAPALATLALDRSSVVGGTQNATGTVTLSASATSSLVVALSSSDTSAVTVPSSVTVASGARTKTFTVSSRSVTSAKTVTITASAGGVSKTATLTVNPPPASPAVTALDVAPVRVSGGATATGSVTLAAPAPSTGTSVQLTSTGPASVPASTLVAPGDTTKEFTISTSSVGADTPATVTASAGGASANATLTVLAQEQSQSPLAVVDAAECRAQTLPANDDGSTGTVTLPFPVNFFGTSYDFLYVNNNGNVTFNSPLSTYTPFRITSSTPPIIAAFLADVDTRGSGSGLVTYSAQGAPATFAGRPAFCVNWVDVGYYSGRTDKLNSVQLLLVDRSDVAPGDVDIVMNYDRILWETGSASGGSNGFGGQSAGAGYSAGTGDPSAFFEFPGTLVNGALLDANPSTGLTRTSRGTLQLGRHIFEVRNGAAPTGGTITGVVTDSATPPNPLSGAPVQVCPAEGGTCRAVTLTGSNGRYQAAGIPEGSYLVTATPPAGSALSRRTVGPVTIAAGETTSQDIALEGPTPPPPGTTLSPSSTNGQGIPNVYWGDPLDLDTAGCSGGQATYEVRKDGAVIASGAMDEGPDGHYTAQIPPLRPASGPAEIVIRIDCPDGTADEEVAFDIYIDPSGNVLTLAGNPVPDAVVTLFRSDSETGPFEPVLDGSAVMSPGNRANPDLTDAAGHFGWDVIAGYYVVRAERDGCTAADGGPYVETGVLPVPPPVFDLDLRLDCPGLDGPSDIEPPTVTATPDRPANAAGWHDGPVTVTFSASDEGAQPSGVHEINVTLSGAENDEQALAGATGEVTISAEGLTRLTYTASDEAGNTSEPQALEVRIDSVAPTVACIAAPAVLWPPNHELRAVTVMVDVTDAGAGASGFVLEQVSSNEADDGLGDGDTPGDVTGWDLGTADGAGQLRAERSGTGTGRVYTLAYEGADAAGNTAACTTQVQVPKAAPGRHTPPR